MKATYEYEARAPGALRSIEIIQYRGRHDPLVVHSLEAQNLPAALALFYRTVLSPLGYDNPLRTGNVLTVTRDKANHEFAARDAV